LTAESLYRHRASLIARAKDETQRKIWHLTLADRVAADVHAGGDLGSGHAKRFSQRDKPTVGRLLHGLELLRSTICDPHVLLPGRVFYIHCLSPHVHRVFTCASNDRPHVFECQSFDVQFILAAEVKDV